MTVKQQGVFICIVGFFSCIRSESKSLETVWLKDATARLKIDKRTLNYDIDLPNELTFHLKRGSDDLRLNLKRNQDINPNADDYFVRKLKDGQSVLVKTKNLEKENAAYYQDLENGAFVTVRCVKRSTGQCDRSISGNIRIGHRSYDLRPTEIDVTSRELSDVPGFLGKPYILRDEEHIIGYSSAKNKDNIRASEKKTEEGLKALLRPFDVQQKHSNIAPAVDTLSPRNVPAFSNRWTIDKSRQLKNAYEVEVAVLIDEAIWNLYSSTVQTFNPVARVGLVKRKIKEAFSHIMNGVNLHYKTIDDPRISIRVILCDFIFFQALHNFRFFPDFCFHDNSPFPTYNEMMVYGTQYIEADAYLLGLAEWDFIVGTNPLPFFDHGMLFTSRKLYLNSTQGPIRGLTFTGEVCNSASKMSIVQAGDYVSTVWAAAHELGHSLGAHHDGEGNAVACNSEDFFIMTRHMPDSDRTKPYSRNRFIFSNCSVEAFKDTLKNKACVTRKGSFFNKQEYKEYVMKQPGDVYSPNQQCHLTNGPKSILCETVPADMCLFMRCTDPTTGICMDTYFGAARGTKCGPNMALGGTRLAHPYHPQKMQHFQAG